MMKSNVISLIKKILVVFLLMSALYYITMVLGYVIPDSLIQSNWTESVNIINGLEDKRWEVNTGFNATKLDTFTDNLIFQKLRNTENLNPLIAAMTNSGYTRYWMGTIPFIRFLLVFMNYGSMRYLNTFVILLLFALVFSSIYKKYGITHALSLAISLIIIQFWIFSLSIQYTPVYIIFMSIIILLLYLDEKNILSAQNAMIVFFITGSLTNFFDLLTAPLLTFGYPFIVYIIIKNFKTNQTFIENFKYFMLNGISWLVGYILTWIANWTITSVVTGENTFANAFNQMGLRTSGGDLLPTNEIFDLLFSTLLPNPALLILLIFIIGIVVNFYFNKFNYKIFLNLSPIIFTIMLPIIWILIMQNHSQIHYYFVYRNLVIILYGLFTWVLLSEKNKT